LGSSKEKRKNKCLWCPYDDGCRGPCERDGGDRRSYVLIRLIDVDRMMDSQRRKLTRRWMGVLLALLGALVIALFVIALLVLLRS
jgi:hypothetical protein